MSITPLLLFVAVLLASVVSPQATAQPEKDAAREFAPASVVEGKLQDYFADSKYQINVGKDTIDMMVFDTTAGTAYLSRGSSYQVAWRQFAFGSESSRRLSPFWDGRRAALDSARQFG